MPRILIIGGHGKVAQRLEPILAERGDTVTAVIRNRDHEADVAATGATPLVADIESFDTEQLTNLVSGNDAVVWSAGAGGGDVARTWAVDRDAAIRSIDAAVAAGVKRYVMVSYFGAGPDHGVPEDDSFYAYAEAKAEADAHLRESGLDWTIVAPSALTLDEPTGRITVGGSGEQSVPRGDVAEVVAAVLAEPATIGRMIEFSGGDTPVADAIAAG
ncbi:SDR family oxidoreductase [Microbacterium thalli]|uniref:SDR family oxidoreductase n=1 Tax=Microbacterium thalli TaxID=3027921 RepID=A0ABT5SFU8_9MICO|nr:SDR family oxidoreductase [Microbacterium thalli]MDD7961674.1 SDR family oxidoreductase [Microbacterium thalli]MDN8549056.1 SDR family oxidoreductase [Microbacterium thalli]